MYNKRLNVINTSPIEPEAVEIKGDKVYVRTNMRIVKYQAVDNPAEAEVEYFCYDETEQLVFDYIKTISKIEPLAERTISATEIFDETCANSDKLRDIFLADFKTLRIAKLKEECSKAIYEGFISDSTDYSFGFNELDQANFTQQTLLIIANGENYTTPIEWKTKDSGVVTFTSEEFLVVISEAENHKRTNQSKYWTLEAQILAAPDKQTVRDIEW